MSDPIAVVLAVAEALKAVLDARQRAEAKAAQDIKDAENAVAGHTAPPKEG